MKVGSFWPLAALLVLVAVSVQAQVLDAPPPLQPAGSSPASAKPELAPNAAADKRGAVGEDEALPDLPPARAVSPETRIEQRRQGNRIVEVTVTPAGTTRSYTIVNREGQRPLSVQELSSGLSTPRFLKFDF
jgi:hypothetical protein